MGTMKNGGGEHAGNNARHRRLPSKWEAGEKAEGIGTNVKPVNSLPIKGEKKKRKHRNPSTKNKKKKTAAVASKGWKVGGRRQERSSAALGGNQKQSRKESAHLGGGGGKKKKKEGLGWMISCVLSKKKRRESLGGSLVAWNRVEERAKRMEKKKNGGRGKKTNSKTNSKLERPRGSPWETDVQLDTRGGEAKGSEQ